MEKEILKLASVLLKDYGEYLSNRISNDVAGELLEAVNEFEDGVLEKILDEWNGGECEDGKHYDWIIAAAISSHLMKTSEL